MPRQKKTLRALAAAGLALLVIVACWARAPRVATPSLPPETPPLGPQRVPAFAALPRHFAPPEKSRWGKDAAAPYPTGAYWLNAALGDRPVPCAPYQVAVTPKGAQLSYSYSRRVATAEAQIDPFGVDWFLEPRRGGDAKRVAALAAARVAALEKKAAKGGYVAAGDALYGASTRTKNATLERRSHLGATADYGGVGVVLCKGSPLVAVEVGKNHAVVLAPGGAGGGRAGRVVAVDAAPAGDLRAVTLRDNSTWALATLGDGCDVAVVDEAIVVAGPCVARLGKAPETDDDWARLAASANRYAVGGEPFFDFEDPGAYELRWQSEGDGELYMLGAPHHNATLVEGVAGPSHLVGAKGPLAWVSGDVWKLREALPKIGLGTAAFTDGTVAADDVAAIAAQCARDVVLAAPTTSAGYGAYGALYFEGKELGRLARLAIACADAGASTAAASAVNSLAARLGTWLGRDDVVGVDATWGGAAARSGYPLKSTRGATGDPFADFGNALFSDHHFQFGYYAYAAATVAARHPDGPALLEAWRPRLDALVLDYASYEASSYPMSRHKDWYDGHSWATGLVAYETGKSQESSSEAAHGYLGAALYGAAVGDARLEAFGRLCLATEVRGARTYWRMPPGGAVYEEAFAANRVAGGVAGSAAVATTWFGSNPEYVHGINAIPVISGLTDLLLDPLDACAEAPILRAALARRPPAPPVAPEWQGFAAASLAAADAAAAWATAAALDEAAFDDGASKANLLHWIATARAKRKYAACGPALDNATVAPELPWNASGVDVSCEGNLACAALGLSGLCCPQLDGYMFGCCPVLKGEVPTAPPTTS